MTDLPNECRLSDDAIAELGITQAQADYGAARGLACGPLSPEQRDQLAVLLRPDSITGHQQNTQGGVA